MFFKSKNQELDYLIEVDSIEAKPVIENMFNCELEEITITPEMDGYRVRKIEKAAVPIDIVEDLEFLMNGDIIFINGTYLKALEDMEIEDPDLIDVSSDKFEQIIPEPIPNWNECTNFDEKFYNIKII